MVGHETTAGSLNFTLLELAQHPSIQVNLVKAIHSDVSLSAVFERFQTRLREEILAHGRDLGYDEIQKLEWLDAVVKEGSVPLGLNSFMCSDSFHIVVVFDSTLLPLKLSALLLKMTSSLSTNLSRVLTGK